MQVCGSKHPDHYKRSLDERSDTVTNVTTEDLNACISLYSRLLGGANNVSFAMWQLYAVGEIAVMKQYDMSLNVTEELAGWAAKFAKWDSNCDGFLTWEEAMVVQPWSWP
jgi:hypothetical protein